MTTSELLRDLQKEALRAYRVRTRKETLVRAHLTELEGHRLALERKAEEVAAQDGPDVDEELHRLELARRQLADEMGELEREWRAFQFRL